MKLYFRKKGESSHIKFKKKEGSTSNSYKNELETETNIINQSKNKKMEHFEKINFDTFLYYFEEASDNGTRIRTSDPEKWRNFQYENKIYQFVVEKAIKELPGCKMTIIETGIGKGLYLYSWNMDNPNSNYCYKYK